MKMIEVVGAFIAGGVAGAIAKDKLSGNAQQQNNRQAEMDAIYVENEKLSRRNKEMERQVEDLLSELNKVRRKAKENDNNSDDLEDELDKAKRELKNMRLQYDELARKVKEYQSLCKSKDAEIETLKEKL